MKRIGLNRHTRHFFWAFGLSVFLAFGLSTLHAATLPAKDSAVSNEPASEESIDHDANWFLWLEEGNTQTFIQELNKIAQCVESEKVDVEQLPAKIDEMSPCQRKVWNAVNYRDPDGHSLLQTFLKHSKPDRPIADSFIEDSLIEDSPIDIFTLLAIKDAFDVIDALLKIGMTLVDWDNQQPDFDNLFFLIIQYDRPGLLNQLLAGIKKSDAKKFDKLAQLRSSKGVSIANALQQKGPDELFVLHIITNYELVREAEELKIKTGGVYTGVEAHLKGKKSEL